MSNPNATPMKEQALWYSLVPLFFIAGPVGAEYELIHGPQASDPMAVVNQYGQVRGIDCLRVVDASIMPNVIRANTNVTTMVIGELIADFIKQDSIKQETKQATK